jgi:predicted membrane channel-forming protein YqfA (hemolysin III family)
LFLGLTIFTVSKLPRYVEPCIEQLLRMRTGIITSLPSYLHLPHCLDSSSLSGTSSSENCSKHITRWPFFVFLGGAMFCLLSSTTCHLFSCISARWSSLLLRVDYIGIALLIAGSFYPPVLHHYLHENSSSSGLIQLSGWLHVFFLGFCTNLSSAVQEPANRSQRHCCLMLYMV